jgi:lysophospholipid acyltransferase (LPLAT)-like uncharacterized protein
MWKNRLALALAPRLASAFIRLQRRLMRLRWVNEEVVLAEQRAGRPYVHAFFHDQLLMMNYSYLGQRFGRRLAVLASRHRDGEYVARTLERFGHLLVRGSSGRGGAGGLRQMVRHLRDGRDVAFAVDGPRGPRHQVQMGAVEAARLGRAVIVPVAFAASGKKNFIRGIDSRFPSPFRAACSCTVSRSPFLPMPAAT